MTNQNNIIFEKRRLMNITNTLHNYLSSHTKPVENWQNINDVVDTVLRITGHLEEEKINYPTQSQTTGTGWAGHKEDAPDEFKEELQDLADDDVRADMEDNLK